MSTISPPSLREEATTPDELQSGEEIREAPLSPEAWQYLQWLFGFHSITIRQRIFTIAEKYDVLDAQGTPAMVAVRPRYIGLNLLATFMALVPQILFLILAFRLILFGQEFLLALVILFVGGFLTRMIRRLLAPFRDMTIHCGAEGQQPALFVSQDNKIGLHYWFTIYDALGQPVARVRRHAITALWRKTWLAETLDGRLICRMREDSLLLALLRRYLGPLLGMLRTNYDVELPTGQRIGEFNRKFTIRDTYLLDLRGDPEFLVDRRVALAMAILVDTGDRR